MECKSCRFLHKFLPSGRRLLGGAVGYGSGYILQCRRSPPAIGVYEGSPALATWVHVSEDWWCGEYKPATNDEETS